MGITAKVVNTFKADEHKGHVYKPGDTYPAEGHEAGAERVAFLATSHPKYNKIYLADVKGDEGSAEEFPKHLGGGTFEISNGEKVKGKEAAAEAEKALENKAAPDPDAKQESGE